jgi:hypothetical protein
VKGATFLAVAGGLLLASCRCAPGTQDSGDSPSSVRAKGAGSAASTASGVPGASAVALDSGAPDAVVDAEPPLPPLVETARFVHLEVPDFRSAVVSVPLGAREPRPVVVALHGNFDRPEWQCQVWRQITGGYPFILCPRGVPRGDAPKKWDRWTYGARQKVQAELLAGLDALSARYPDHVHDGPVVYTGFSLGAILGRAIIREHAERFPRAVMTEGGNKGWESLARAYAKAGGKRVLFACGQIGCVGTSKRAARHAKRAGLAVRVADGGKVGHTYDGPVQEAITESWNWLVAGDDRWPDAEPLESEDAGVDGGSAEDGAADGGSR